MLAVSLTIALVAASPANIDSVLASLKGGDVVRLESGTYSPIKLSNRLWDPAVIIEAGKASLLGLALQKVDGVTLKGGVFISDALNKGGAIIRLSKNIAISGASFSGVFHGVIIDRSTDSEISNSTFDNMQVDGIDLALSQRVKIISNTFRSPVPIDRISQHPDGIQCWSRPGGITSDIDISGNDISGDSQGIFCGNHVRNGVDDGGFDRISIKGNKINISWTHGIMLGTCRACVVTDNVVRRKSGGRWAVRFTVEGRDKSIVERNQLIQ